MTAGTELFETKQNLQATEKREILNPSMFRVLFCTLLLLLLLSFLAPPKAAYALDTPLDFVNGNPTDTSFDWDPASKTLRLSDGFELNIAADFVSSAINLPADSTIIVEGTATITFTPGIQKVDPDDTTFASGIFCEGNLAIKGGGALTINLPAQASDALGIRAIEVDEGGQLFISEAVTLDLTAVGGDNTYVYGMNAESGIFISGGCTITCDITTGSGVSVATGLSATGRHIMISGGMISISEESKVTVTTKSGDGGGQNVSSGLVGFGVLITGGSEVTCEVSGGNNMIVEGILSNGDLTISDSKVKVLTQGGSQSGESFGFYCSGSTTINEESLVEIKSIGKWSLGLFILENVLDISERSTLVSEGETAAFWIGVYSTAVADEPVLIGPGLAVLEGGTLAYILEPGNPTFRRWSYSNEGAISFDGANDKIPGASTRVVIGLDTKERHAPEKQPELLAKTGDSAGALMLICAMGSLVLLGAGCVTKRKVRTNR